MSGRKFFNRRSLTKLARNFGHALVFDNAYNRMHNYS
jgi:hypothetical protein